MPLTLPANPPDRRRSQRVTAEWPCKVYHHPSRRYLPARTCDISGSGVLVRVNTPRELQVGEKVDILIARDEGQLLDSRDARSGTVARALQGSGRTVLVGVHFDAPASQIESKSAAA